MAARGNALLEFRLGERREGKLDALLRKELSALDYERVVATEVCVCVFPRGKKVHGHVVLEGNYLTFVPIPVKKAQRLTKLIDIVSTSMVNDRPNFLPKKESEKTTHLAINYTKNRDFTKTPPITPPTSPNYSNPSSPIASSTNVMISPTHTNDASNPIETFDIYLLNDETTFISYLMPHLEDIQFSILCPRQYIEVSIDKVPLNQQYLSLKLEILSAKSVETSASLYLELIQAIERYFQIKLIFWQDDRELLLYSIDHMKELTSTCSTVDKLEYYVIVIEFLLKVFQDTLVSRHRYILLTQNRAEIIERLTLKLLDTYSEINLVEVDKKLLVEFVNVSAGLLYELSRVVAQQTKDHATISWWCNLCGTHVNFGIFQSKLVEGLCHMLTDPNQMTPFYYIVSLALTLVTHSQVILESFASHCYEEFMYLIVSPPQSDVACLLDARLDKLRSLILQH